MAEGVQVLELKIFRGCARARKEDMVCLVRTSPQLEFSFASYFALFRVLTLEVVICPRFGLVASLEVVRCRWGQRLGLHTVRHRD